METQTHLFQETVTLELSLPYLLFLPEGYGATADKWPLIISLHGYGERGTDTQSLFVHGLPKRLKEGFSLPALVLAPQCPLGTTWPLETRALEGLLENILKTYPVDSARVYLTGLSMGGYGTWAWAAEKPARFAAIAPVCGGGSWLQEFPERVCRLVGMPIWAFHGAKDKVVPLSETQELVDTLQECGGEAKLTVYPNATHDSWTQTYANDELYAWLLAQRRELEP